MLLSETVFSFLFLFKRFSHQRLYTVCRRNRWCVSRRPCDFLACRVCPKFMYFFSHSTFSSSVPEVYWLKTKFIRPWLRRTWETLCIHTMVQIKDQSRFLKHLVGILREGWRCSCYKGKGKGAKMMLMYSFLAVFLYIFQEVMQLSVISLCLWPPQTSCPQKKEKRKRACCTNTCSDTYVHTHTRSLSWSCMNYAALWWLQSASSHSSAGVFVLLVCKCATCAVFQLVSGLVWVTF